VKVVVAVGRVYHRVCDHSADSHITIVVRLTATVCLGDQLGGVGVILLCLCRMIADMP
jgi:hypothetical protein